MSWKVGKGRYKKQVYRDFSLHFERKKNDLRSKCKIER